MLTKAGFIRYVRGKITITDRRGLESVVIWPPLSANAQLSKRYRRIISFLYWLGLDRKQNVAIMGESLAGIYRILFRFIRFIRNSRLCRRHGFGSNVSTSLETCRGY